MIFRVRLGHNEYDEIHPIVVNFVSKRGQSHTAHLTVEEAMTLASQLDEAIAEVYGLKEE